MGILPDWMIKAGVKIEPMAGCEHCPGTISYGLTSYGYDARVGYKFQVFQPYGAVEIDPKKFDPKALHHVDLTPNHNHTFDGDGRCVRCSANRGTPSETTWQCIPRSEGHILIPPHSFALAETVEHLEIPRDVLCVVVGKSTYARCGIVTPLTPLEPEWRGKVTVEIGNTTPLPARVYAGEGMMQLLFFRTDGVGEATLAAIRRLLAPGLLYPTRGVPDRPLSEVVGGIEELLHKDLGRATCELSYADKKGVYQNQKGIVHPTVTRGES